MQQSSGNNTFFFFFLLFLCSIHQFSKFSNYFIRFFFYLRSASWCCCQLQEAEHLPEHCCVCAGPQRHWAWAALCQWYSRYAHSSLTLNKKKKKKQRWVKQHSIFNNTLSYFFTRCDGVKMWLLQNIQKFKTENKGLENISSYHQPSGSSKEDQIVLEVIWSSQSSDLKISTHPVPITLSNVFKAAVWLNTILSLGLNKDILSTCSGANNSSVLVDSF